MLKRMSLHNKIKLCFVADDYGESKETNEAIEQICTGSVVRSVTVVSSESSVYSDFLLQTSKDIALGIHLYLSDYTPLTDKLKALTKKSKAMTKSNIIFSLMTRKISPHHIYEEFDTQISRLRERGHRPHFIDTHQNIHALPLIFQIVRRIATKYGLENNIRPFAQLNFSPKKTLRPILSKLHSAAVNFRRRSRVLVDCPEYQKNSIQLDEALAGWDTFLTSVRQRAYDEIFVPCHPGVSPAEIDLYSSLDFLKLIYKHQMLLTKGI